MEKNIIPLQEVEKSENITTCVIVKRKPQLEVDYLLIDNKRLIRCEQPRVDFSEEIHVKDEDGNLIGRYRRTRGLQTENTSDEVAIWIIIE